MNKPGSFYPKSLNYGHKQRGRGLSQNLPYTIKTKTRVFVTIKPSLKLYVSTLRIRLKWVKSRTVNPTTDIDGRPPSEQLILRSTESIDVYGEGRSPSHHLWCATRAEDSRGISNPDFSGNQMFPNF